MGSLKLEQRQKVESDQERGQEIQENAETKVEEAEVSQQALEQIEAIDDDDKAAVDAARSEAEGGFGSLVESKIKVPFAEIYESLIDIDYIDENDLSSLLNDLNESTQDTMEETEQTESEIQSKIEQMVGELENLF